MPLADFQDVLPRLVREHGNKVTAPDFDRALASAVRQYSQDKPRQLVRDYTWPAAGYTAPGVPTELTEDSAILRAEYPVGQVPAALVGVTHYVTDAPLGLLCESALPAGAVVRITFTAAHQLVGGSAPVDTIPVRDRDAVLNYAAHLLCRELATLYAGERESSIAADGSNTDSRARSYAARSRDYRAAYFAQLGIADPMGGSGGGGASSASASQGAGAVVGWGARPRPSWRTNGANSARPGEV